MPRVAVADYARAIAQLPYSDGEFSVPERPALRPEVVVCRLPDALLLAGAVEPVSVRGAAAVIALAELLPLLDGRRDAIALAEASGLALPDVRQLLGVLAMRTLLRDGPPASSAVPDVQQRQLSRGVARTGWHDSADGVLDALTAARVAVTGPAALATALRAELATCGVAGVESADAHTATLVVHCWDRAPRAAQLRALAEELDAGGPPVLPVLLSGDELIVGPYLDRAGRPCVQCCLAVEGNAGVPAGEDRCRLAAGLLAVEVAQLIGGFGRSVTATSQVRHDLAGWTTRYLDLTARPGCLRCLPGVPGREQPAGLQLVRDYEAAVSLPHRRWLPPALHREHYRPEHLATQNRFTAAPGEVRTADAAGQSVLLNLLRASLGMRRADAAAAPDRCAPSAGNLGSIVGYCLIDSDSDSNGDGSARVCQYHPLRDELRTLPVDVTEVAACRRSLLADRRPVDSGQVSVALLLTADLTKLTPKYGLKAYRLGYLEAGALLGQLALLVAAAGGTLRAASAWDDQLCCAVLGSDARGELLCAVATIDLPVDSLSAAADQAGDCR